MRKLQTHTWVAILKCVPKGPNSQASTQSRIKELCGFLQHFKSPVKIFKINFLRIIRVNGKTCLRFYIRQIRQHEVIKTNLGSWCWLWRSLRVESWTCSFKKKKKVIKNYNNMSPSPLYPHEISASKTVGYYCFWKNSIS